MALSQRAGAISRVTWLVLLTSIDTDLQDARSMSKAQDTKVPNSHTYSGVSNLSYDIVKASDLCLARS